MDKQAGKTQTQQSGACTSSDYTQGLRILARLVARRHMRRMNNRLESKDGISKNE